MKNLARITLASSILFVISGCQTIQGYLPDTSQKTFTAPSFYGKELPSGFVSEAHGKNADNGHRFRGYHIGKRHWDF